MALSDAEFEAITARTAEEYALRPRAVAGAFLPERVGSDRGKPTLAVWGGVFENGRMPPDFVFHPESFLGFDGRAFSWIEHADHLHAAGQPLRAQEVLEAAIAWAAPSELREEARLQLGVICRQTDQARSIAHCEEALANAATPQLRARAEARLGLLYEAALTNGRGRAAGIG